VRSSFAQRVVVYFMFAGVFVALVLGFWPVHAAVDGNSSYSCGSGFVHSRHDWRVDSVLSKNARISEDTSVGTPAQVCPAVVYDRRDLALLIGGATLVLGVLLIALTAPRESRADRAVLASARLRRRGVG
jgi:uncharacterized membrane protein YedE/YeeE